jgi:flavin-dependent dehydrogenase
VFDLAVIGAGPAGSACALMAARLGLNTALFEAQPEPPDKPCGEGIMPPGVDALRVLGLDEVLAGGRAFRSLRYVVARVEPFTIALPRPGVAIDRPRLMHAFESQLWNAGTMARHHGRVAVDRVRGGADGARFAIRCDDRAWSARTLVAADGLHGKAAAWLRAGAPVKRSGASRVGVRARYAAARALDGVEIHFDAGTEIYLTPLAGDRINVAVLVDESHGRGGATALLESALSRNPRAACYLAERWTEPAARVLSCTIPPVVARDAAFLAGDAGGGVDPILGCGVTLALESGIRAARAARSIVDGDVSGDPERDYVRAYREQTRSRRALARFLLALSRHPTLARGTFQSVRVFPRLIDALVGIAAGDEAPSSALVRASAMTPR